MTHRCVIENQFIAHLNRRTYRFRCRTCGAHTPWTSKEAAEHARQQHERGGGK